MFLLLTKHFCFFEGCFINKIEKESKMIETSNKMNWRALYQIILLKLERVAWRVLSMAKELFLVKRVSQVWKLSYMYRNVLLLATKYAVQLWWAPPLLIAGPFTLSPPTPHTHLMTRQQPKFYSHADLYPPLD